MSEITLKAIEDLLEDKLEEKLEQKLEPIRQTLDIHTSSLEKLMSEKLHKESNEVVSNHRIDRLEEWAKKAGGKIGVSPEF